MAYYPWPASGITTDDMRLLFEARQRSRPRQPINQLIAHAIRQTFNAAASGSPATTQSARKEIHEP